VIHYKGINHIALVTSDMNKTVRFWRDLLELRLVATFGKPGYRQYFFEVSEHDMVTFFEWGGAEPLEEKEHGVPMPGPRVFDHISLGLADEDELWKLKDRLDASGEWVSEVIDHGFIHSIYTFDPNGVPLEFSIYVKGVDVHRDPVAFDDDPAPAAAEGAGPMPEKWPEVKNPTPHGARSVHPGMGSEAFERHKK
jgi:catechol 2,3-dioxygenase-like lactoylglutathione lyase family enzyme